MDCKQFSALLDDISPSDFQGRLPDELSVHIGECSKCRQILSIRRDFAGMDDNCEIPAEFSQNWRKTIRKEAISAMKPHTISWRTAVALAATFVFIIGGTLITGGKLPANTATKPGNYDSEERLSSDGADMSSSSMASGIMPEFSPEVDGSGKAYGQAEAKQTAKVIRTADFTLATRTFDLDMEAIKSRISGIGGRIESANTNGDPSQGDTRSAYLTLRVPSSLLDEFIVGLHGIGRVIHSAESSQDVSDSYYDISSRLSTQETKMERLQALMGTAAVLSDLIELESAIADTQYMIDSYKGQLQGYDSKVNESNVNITLYEETAKEASEAKALTIGERILLGFRASLDAARSFLSDLVVFLTVALPWLFGAAVIIIIVSMLIRRKRK